MSTSTVTDTSPTQTPLGLGDWQVAAGQSKVAFETRIAFGLVPVRGRFTDYSGELYIDGAGNARGQLRVQAETLSTGIKKRDRHLRSTDFFAVEEHPQMTFELDSLRPAADGSLQLAGTLHLRGRTIGIKAPISLQRSDADGLRLSAEFDVDHRSAGLLATGPGWKKVPEKLRANVDLALVPLA
jgi:polyisoprenoid-binding protein YceI